MSIKCLVHSDIQPEENLRHPFYSVKDELCKTPTLGLVNDGDVVAVDRILNPSSSEMMHVVDKLTLARSLVPAVP